MTSSAWVGDLLALLFVEMLYLRRMLLALFGTALHERF
jgi:hypothetical protein